jgi:chaperonin GroES
MATKAALKRNARLSKEHVKSTETQDLEIKPNYNTLIVEPLTDEHMSAGGIIIPETVDVQNGEDVRSGYVLVVGPSLNPETPFLFQVGDLVTFGEYQGRRITLNGKEYNILRHNDVLCSSSCIL